MLYIVCNSYQPNTAPTNRLLSFLRGFSELGTQVEVVFLEPDSNYNKVTEHLPNIYFNYMWDRLRKKNRFIEKLAGFYWGWKFSKNLKAGDKVILLTAGRVFFNLINRKDVKLYHERTEHPDIYMIKGFDIKKYKARIKDLDGMFVISTALKGYFSSLGLAKEKIEIVNMTVDSNRFINLRKEPSEKYIAYCGTAFNNKDGVDELIKSFAIVHKVHPEVKLYIIGKTLDPKDVSGNLKLMETLGLKDSIVFTGIVSAADMPQILKNATILTLDRPDSLQAQCGFPTKLGEYLLTENPVVVTEVGDIPLFLKDGETAILAEERNQEDFSSKLIWALEHPVESAKIGKAGAQVAMREFNYLTETKEIIKAIQYFLSPISWCLPTSEVHHV